ncbi:hypothetical protein PACILC2_53880 [Paenibacillus cisolokensis]|uniref:TOTE conflict system primase domain-containing protein n=1 Tax=Paenibacillus cisolokensis TaxID=1658519 RepID=A0ABQ4NF50_9BACL|nr:hypothetical protein [Paenibacillus cisolokensis]GIQ66820.1 hypothetical protein PACILC2_53880 [Paenibacillus cisolokensis]
MGNDEQSIITKLKDLYIIQYGHYIIQYPEPRGYCTYIKGEIQNGKRTKPLLDWQFQKHLNGKFTVGTFGGKVMTKFMTFDVDFNKNPQLTKWITYKVAKTLDDLNLHNYYISFSGSKGYHIDLFFDEYLQIIYAQKLFAYVIELSDVKQYFIDGDKIEFRPTDRQGVKLPLGIHQKTEKYCGFCLVEDGLKVMATKESIKYLLAFRKRVNKK